MELFIQEKTKVLFIQVSWNQNRNYSLICKKKFNANPTQKKTN